MGEEYVAGGDTEVTGASRGGETSEGVGVVLRVVEVGSQGTPRRLMTRRPQLSVPLPLSPGPSIAHRGQAAHSKPGYHAQ